MNTHTINWIKSNPGFCVAPLSHNDLRFNYNYQQNTSGFKVTACCNLDVTKSSELDFDFIDNLKKDQLQNKVHAACWKCTNDEHNLVPSERVKLMLNYSVEELEQFKYQQKTNEFTVATKFSNLCNLACRSCNSSDSSLWANLMESPPPGGYEIDISDNESHWCSLIDMIRAKHSTGINLNIQLVGGETLIQPGFVKLLNWLIEENIASTSTLRITTSLAVSISEKFSDKFVQFKHVLIIASIDSIDDNYHYVRWPAKFNKIANNLQEFDLLSKQYPGKFSLCVSPVFSLNNIFYAVDYLNWWEKWATETDTDLWLSAIHLYEPEHLMIENIPQTYHAQLLEVLHACADHSIFKKYQRTTVIQYYFQSMIESICNNNNNNEANFNEYLRFTADYDNRTNTDSYTLNSKLFDLLTDAHKQIYNAHLTYVQPKV
jgi:hypothetical protein